MTMHRGDEQLKKLQENWQKVQEARGGYEAKFYSPTGSPVPPQFDVFYQTGSKEDLVYHATDWLQNLDVPTENVQVDEEDDERITIYDASQENRAMVEIYPKRSKPEVVRLGGRRW